MPNYAPELPWCGTFDLLCAWEPLRGSSELKQPFLMATPDSQLPGVHSNVHFLTGIFKKGSWVPPIILSGSATENNPADKQSWLHVDFVGWVRNDLAPVRASIPPWKQLLVDQVSARPTWMSLKGRDISWKTGVKCLLQVKKKKSDGAFLWIPGQPGPCYVDQVNCELVVILLLQPHFPHHKEVLSIQVG